MAAPPVRKRRPRFAYALLALPLLATLFPQFYAHSEPTLIGIPFFYWYLIAWTLGCGAVTGTVYALTRDGEA